MLQLKGHTWPPCRCARKPGTQFLIRWPYLKAWLVHLSFNYPANNYQSYQKLDSLQEQWTFQNVLRFLTLMNSQTRKRKAVVLRLFLFWPGTQGYLKVEEPFEVGQAGFWSQAGKPDLCSLASKARLLLEFGIPSLWAGPSLRRGERRDALERAAPRVHTWPGRPSGVATSPAAIIHHRRVHKCT